MPYTVTDDARESSFCGHLHRTREAAERCPAYVKAYPFAWTMPAKRVPVRRNGATVGRIIVHANADSHVNAADAFGPWSMV